MMMRYATSPITATLKIDLNRFIATCLERKTFLITVAGSNFILLQSILSG